MSKIKKIKVLNQHALVYETERAQIWWSHVNLSKIYIIHSNVRYSVLLYYASLEIRP